jgi:2-polyprenyl-3-methyl-5-hydroxy-6-metoxy-1,4-benzoquinol methylase
MNCRHCKNELSLSLVDLGFAPPSNAYLTTKAMREPEKYYPLRVLVCEKCWLVQTEDFTRPHDLFDNQYAYFSGVSSTWLSHCKKFVEEMKDNLKLNASSHVIEVAANDGYLLQYVQAFGIPCTGIEPTTSTATSARAKGLDIVEDFFGVRLAKELVSRGKTADLTIANNVLAHVDEINDFVQGFAELLKPHGVAVFEFPHLINLIEKNQFDTIYHEHFSYLSFSTVVNIFDKNGLNVFDVKEVDTHGGSLRVFSQRTDTGTKTIEETVHLLIKKEKGLGVQTPDFYEGFQKKAEKVKDDLLTFLLKSKKEGKKVAAYGAAAKGNTLLNYAGIGPDLIRFVVDENPAKQGKFLPGSHLPICDQSKLKNFGPDYILILPWNISGEIMANCKKVCPIEPQFVTAVPELKQWPK